MTFDIRFRPKLAVIAAACLLSVALPSAAMAQKTKIKTPAAATTETAMPKFTVDIATIDAVGSSVDDDTLRAIFSGDLVDNADALASLDATSITIPAITIDFTGQVEGGPTTGKFTFKNVVLDNVADGVAASVSLGGMELTSDQDVGAKFGTISASNFDIGGMLGIYGLVDAGDQTELATIYSNFSAAGGSFSGEGVNCDIGAMSAAEFKGRPLKYNFADMMAMTQEMDAQSKGPSPELVGMALRMYADIFTAFESSPVTFGGFDCKGTDDSGAPLGFSVASMTMDGMSPGIYPAITMKDMRIAVEGDGMVSVGDLSFKAMDLSGPIAAVAAAPQAIDEAWLTANMRSLIPAFAGFSFSDIKVDMPDRETGTGRVKASIGDFDLSLGKYFNGIPTDISTTASNIVVDLPTNTGDEQLQQLLDLGVTSVDVGFAIKAAWNEATNAIDLKEVSVDGADLASVVLAGTIGNVTAALFDSDSNIALASAMGVVVNNLKVEVLDKGLSDLILNTVSAEQGTDPATMRPIFAGLAEGTVLGMLAGATEAQKVSKAVNAFVAGTAKSLSIEMTPKDPAGLGLMDFLAAEQDPTLLIGKTNITATAK